MRTALHHRAGIVTTGAELRAIKTDAAESALSQSRTAFGSDSPATTTDVGRSVVEKRRGRNIAAAGGRHCKSITGGSLPH